MDPDDNELGTFNLREALALERAGMVRLWGTSLLVSPTITR